MENIGKLPKLVFKQTNLIYIYIPIYIYSLHIQVSFCQGESSTRQLDLLFHP